MPFRPIGGTGEGGGPQSVQHAADTNQVRRKDLHDAGWRVNDKKVNRGRGGAVECPGDEVFRTEKGPHPARVRPPKKPLRKRVTFSPASSPRCPWEPSSSRGGPLTPRYRRPRRRKGRRSSRELSSSGLPPVGNNVVQGTSYYTKTTSRVNHFISEKGDNFLPVGGKSSRDRTKVCR